MLKHNKYKKGEIYMQCTNDIEFSNETINTNLKRKIRGRERISNILKIVNNHKVFATVVTMFITFSILNIVLIVNFMAILEKNIYI